MQNFLRSLVLVATTILAAAPAHADRMGTNPRPTAVAAPSVTRTILHFFGF